MVTDYETERYTLQIVVAAFVLTLTCTIKSVVKGQAPVTLELRNNQGEETETKHRWYTRFSAAGYQVFCSGILA